MNKRAILINSKDNVVTTLDALLKGDEIVFSAQEKTESIKVNEDIRVYNKIASKDIKKGDFVIKYGEIIGEACEDISIGDSVDHLNIKSLPRDYHQE